MARRHTLTARGLLQSWSAELRVHERTSHWEGDKKRRKGLDYILVPQRKYGTNILVSKTLLCSGQREVSTHQLRSTVWLDRSSSETAKLPWSSSSSRSNRNLLPISYRCRRFASSKDINATFPTAELYNQTGSWVFKKRVKIGKGSIKEPESTTIF